MEPTDIKWNDWHRIFLGTMPPVYYLEILGRVVFIYLLIVFCMRLMGKRMSSHLTRNEMVALTSLAAAVGMPILSFDKGLLPAAIVALLVVAGQRIISSFSCISPSFERATQGDLEILMENGRLHMDKLSTTRVSKERLFSMLRENEFIHLGQVKRVYFEANGTFNLVEEKTPPPGLCILPPSDSAFLEEQKWVPAVLVCNQCGAPVQKEDSSCRYCHHHTFVHAVQ